MYFKIFIKSFSASLTLTSRFTAIEYNKIVIDPYRNLTSFRNGCQWECDRDSNCNGFSDNISTCFLSKCDSYIDVQCPLCKFARKQVPTTTVVCPSYPTTSMSVTTDGNMETTQQRGHVSDPSVAEVTETYSNATLCPCVCTNASRSLNESIKMRRNELKVNKTALTSSIRRRTSASDHRMSSRVIGAVGIIIIVIFGMMIICSDVLSVFHFKSITV